jgi:hypothetical protein
VNLFSSIVFRPDIVLFIMERVYHAREGAVEFKIEIGHTSIHVPQRQ